MTNIEESTLLELSEEQKQDMKTDCLIIYKNITNDASNLDEADLKSVASNLTDNLEDYLMKKNPYCGKSNLRKEKYQAYFDDGHPESFTELQDLLMVMMEGVSGVEKVDVPAFYEQLKDDFREKKNQLKTKTALLNSVKVLETQVKTHDIENTEKNHLPGADDIKVIIRNIKERLESVNNDNELPLNTLITSLVCAEQMYERSKESVEGILQDEDIAKAFLTDSRKKFSETLLYSDVLKTMLDKIDNMKELYSKINLEDPSFTRGIYECDKEKFEQYIEEYEIVKNTYAKDNKDLFKYMDQVVLGFKEFETLLNVLESKSDDYAVIDIARYNDKFDEIRKEMEVLIKEEPQVKNDISYLELANKLDSLTVLFDEKYAMSDKKVWTFLAVLENAKIEKRFMNISIHEGEESLATKSKKLNEVTIKAVDWKKKALDLQKEYKTNIYVDSIDNETKTECEKSAKDYGTVEELERAVLALVKYREDLDKELEGYINVNYSSDITTEKKAELVKKLNVFVLAQKGLVNQQIDKIVNGKLKEVLNSIKKTPVPKVLRRMIEMPKLEDNGEPLYDLSTIINRLNALINDFDADFKSKKSLYDKTKSLLTNDEDKSRLDGEWNSTISGKKKEKVTNLSEGSSIKTWVDRNRGEINKCKFIYQDIRNGNNERQPYTIDLTTLEWLIKTKNFPLSDEGKEVLYKTLKPEMNKNGTGIINREKNGILADVNEYTFLDPKNIGRKYINFDEKKLATTDLNNLPTDYDKFTIELLPENFGEMLGSIKNMFNRFANKRKVDRSKDDRKREGLSYMCPLPGKDLCKVIVADLNNPKNKKVEISEGSQNELNNNIASRINLTQIKCEEGGKTITKGLSHENALALQMAYIMERKDWGDMKGEIFNVLSAAILTKNMDWITDLKETVANYKTDYPQIDFVTKNLSNIDLKKDVIKSLERLFFQVTMLEPIIKNVILESQHAQGKENVKYEEITLDEKIKLIAMDERMHYFLEQVMNTELKLNGQRFANGNVTQNKTQNEEK